MAAEILYEGEALSPEDFERLARRAAASMARCGIGENDRVAVLLRNDPVFLVVQRAAHLLGAYLVPVNWHFLRQEVLHLLQDSGASLLVAHADLLSRLQGTPPDVQVVQVPTPAAIVRRLQLRMDEPPVEAVPLWNDWLAEIPFTGNAKPMRAPMSYTSGTTGRPKGVLRKPMQEEHVQRVQVLYREVLGLRPGARMLLAAPLYHGAPNLQAQGTLAQGELLVMTAKFDAEEMLQLIERHRITHVYCVPTMFVRMLQLPQATRSRYDVTSLQFALHTAAPCPVDVKRTMIEWWGPVIHEFYGSNESGIVAYCDSNEWLAHPGTVGRPAPGATVMVLDENGQPVPAGATGTLFVNQKAYPEFTYHGMEDKRQEIAHGDLFTLGDVGYKDEEGYVFICDRRSDMVISGGVNIYPAEIEAELIEMPGVRDCAVLGAPDPEFGEALVAFVDGPGLTSGQVRDWLAGRLAGYKVPRQVRFRPDLPRDPNGKIFKRRLREELWAGAGRRI